MSEKLTRNVLIISVSVLFFSLLSSSPALALPLPNHEMWFGYYHVDSQYGDFKDEVKEYTNVQIILEESFIRDDLNEAGKLQEAMRETQELGHKIIYGMGKESLWDRGIDAARPYWDDITFIYLADEPTWNKTEVEETIERFSARVSSLGLARKEIAINFTYDQIKNKTGYQASNLDIIGIEAYLDSRDQNNDPVLKLRNIVQELQTLIGNKKHFIVLQGYDRNGTWTNMGSLRDIQSLAYDVAYQNTNTIGLLVFSWARPGGSKQYPILQNEHRTIASAILGKNIPPVPTPTTTIPPPENSSTIFKNLGAGVLPDVAFYKGKIKVAMHIDGKLKLYTFDYQLNQESVEEIPFTRGQPFPRLMVWDDILWLAYRDGDISRGVPESIKLWRSDTRAVSDLGGGNGNDPVALGNGSIAWQVENFRVKVKAVSESGLGDYIRNGQPTGLSRIDENGSVVLIDEDRLAVSWGVRAWFSGDLIVATDITPHDDNGIVGRFNDDPDTEFNLWLGEMAHTPHAATDGQGNYVVATWNPTARIALIKNGDQPGTTSPSPFTTPQNPPIPTEGLIDLGGLISIIFAWSLRLLGLAVFFVILEAGIRIFTSAGNVATVNAARARIKDALIGALILLAAYLILYTINPDLVRGSIGLPNLPVKTAPR